MIDASQRRRRWWKYVCETGYYEVSVRVCGNIPSDIYYADLQKRQVMLNQPIKIVASKTYKIEAFGGDWTIATVLFVDGYFRLRTDGGYEHPDCGVAGTPNDRRSQVRTNFNSMIARGEAHGREAIWSVENRKSKIEAEERKRIFEYHLKHVKEDSLRREINRRTGRGGKTFFQMLAGIEAINKYTQQ